MELSLLNLGATMLAIWKIYLMIMFTIVDDAIEINRW